MRRSKIQQLIIPRNWLFGRLSYINGNLRNLIGNHAHFTKEELKDLHQARRLINNVIRGKKEESKKLKVKLRNSLFEDK